MTELCKYCSGWNDWKGKCEAPFWCPDKYTEYDDLTEDIELEEKDETQKEK